MAFGTFLLNKKQQEKGRRSTGPDFSRLALRSVSLALSSFEKWLIDLTFTHLIKMPSISLWINPKSLEESTGNGNDNIIFALLLIFYFKTSKWCERYVYISHQILKLKRKKMEKSFSLSDVSGRKKIFIIFFFFLIGFSSSNFHFILLMFFEFSLLLPLLRGNKFLRNILIDKK